MSIRFSIVHDLKSRWAPGNIRTSRMDPKYWRVTLDDLQGMWKIGVETILETPFYDLRPGLTNYNPL